jgi:hypothetical protein
MMHVIIGAGSFSHTHIRVLNELGINDVCIAKKTDWTKDQQIVFREMHPNVSFTFDNNPKVFDKIVHVVTPSYTHAHVLNEYIGAKSIFVEKPSVLYNTQNDLKITNNISHTIYQNDWLSQIQNYRTNKEKPSSIYFRYDVKSKGTVDHITEIWSHVINFISIWFAPNCEIHVNNMTFNNNTTSINVLIDQTSLSIESSNGLTDKSVWELIVDGEVFNSEKFGGSLLLNTFKSVLTNKNPLTNWYDSSWLIHKFRLLSFPEMYDNHYNEFYRRIV